jgi:hypothetical protein
VITTTAAVATATTAANATATAFVLIDPLAVESSPPNRVQRRRLRRPS